MDMSNGDETRAAGEAADQTATSPQVLVEEMRQRLDEINERVKEFIRERPAACVFGALAVGYLVARIARRGS